MRNNTIELHELTLAYIWKIFTRYRYVILLFPLITVLTAFLYVSTLKPVYMGTAFLEVGEVINEKEFVDGLQKTTLLKLDNINNLKVIVTQATGVNVDVPGGTDSIITLSYSDADRDKIKQKLEEAVNFVMKRHQSKSALYKNSDSKIRMTQMIGEIRVSNDPIAPKKSTIILTWFFVGLILGLFFAFFLEFLKINRKPRD